MGTNSSVRFGSRLFKASLKTSRTARGFGILILLGLAGVGSPALAAGDGPAAPLMRYPNTSDTRIAFAARGELWTAPLAGGPASRLTQDPGTAYYPRFSPDGRWVAFTAWRAGTCDVYVIPASGGQARRLTFIAPSQVSNAEVVAWTPDSRNIVFLSTYRSSSSKIERAFSVPLGGGLAQPLPLDHSGLLSFAPDGHAIAFNRIFRNSALPKRYVGGQSQHIYTYDFDSRHLTRITGWKGTDTAPMWFRRKIYFLSDRGAGFRANLWVHDLDTKVVRQVTHFSDFDVDLPSLGGRTISFQQGGQLYALDLPTETLRPVKVDVPDDGARTAPRTVPAGASARIKDAMGVVDYALSADGTELAVSSRGDLFGLRADSTWRNITGTPGADEDHPSWSPDGSWIAYETDAGGEQQLAMRPAAGGAERLLTHFPSGYSYSPVWSPDGSRLAVADANHRLWLVPTGGGPPRQVAADPYSEIRDAAFSPDGNWLAYSMMRPNRQRAIHLYSLANDRDTVVSSPMESDRLPGFADNGRVLVFVSQRHELPLVSDRDDETIIATLNSDGVYAATLDAADPSPLAVRSSSTTIGAPLHLDLPGLMGRAVALPVAPSVIASLETRGDRLFYETMPPQLIDGDLPGEPGALHAFDFGTQADTVIVRGLDNHSLSSDGRHVAFRREGGWHLAGTGANAHAEAALDPSRLRLAIDPRREWNEMFQNAWRLDRDVFFSAAMNGDDWHAVHDAYARLLPHLGSEDDFLYLLAQLQGELASSHTFMLDGQRLDTRPAVYTGRLGVDCGVDMKSGRYRLARILVGDNSRDEFRSPLKAPGLDLKEGDYLLALNGHELKAPMDPASLLVGATDRVTLTVAPSPTGPGRTLVVTPLDDEGPLRGFDQMMRNRQTVERLSHGRIGYVALSDFAGSGWGEFVRQFYPQAGKEGLVIDVRWNHGGFTSQAVLAVLRRSLAGVFVNRERAVSSLPVVVPPRDMVTLLNWGSASDGDQFPYFFREYGLGPLVGTRSWGGVQGINRPWSLMDGTAITIPKDSLAEPSGRWIIENTGVTPDVDVDDRPDEALTGRDIQLETAVKVALDRLAAHPPAVAKAPASLPAYPSAGEVPAASFSR